MVPSPEVKDITGEFLTPVRNTTGEFLALVTDATGELCMLITNILISWFDYLILRCDLDLEDSKPIFLENGSRWCITIPHLVVKD